MNKIYLIPLTLIILFSCKNQSETRETLITFENALEYDENTISFESARFVKLENHEDAFIGEGVKMKMVDDKIYILDNHTQGSLLCFNKEGKFINKIGQRGKGPEEYLSLYDFCLKGDTIQLLIRNSKSYIFRFFTDGIFLDKLELNKRTMAFEYSPENKYLINTGYTNSDKYRVHILDNKGNTLQSHFENVDNIIIDLVEPGNGFYKYNESIVFWETFNDTIYIFRDNALFPGYIMDFGSYSNSNINKSQLFGGFDQFTKQLQEGISDVRGYYENKNYVLIHYSFQKQMKTNKNYLLLYNKKNKSIKVLTFSSDNQIVNKLKGFTEDNEIAFVVYPYGKELDDLKQLIPANVIIPELKEKDNAMLVFCKISSDN